MEQSSGLEAGASRGLELRWFQGSPPDTARSVNLKSPMISGAKALWGVIGLRILPGESDVPTLPGGGNPRVR